MNYLVVLMSLKEHLENQEKSLNPTYIHFLLLKVYNVFMKHMIKKTIIVYMNCYYQEQNTNYAILIMMVKHLKIVVMMILWSI